MVGMRANKCRGQTKQLELLPFLVAFFGWYAMALVDVLDYFPKDHPKRIVSYLNQLAESLVKFQDNPTLVSKLQTKVL
jgi:hypothetical protein